MKNSNNNKSMNNVWVMDLEGSWQLSLDSFLLTTQNISFIMVTLKKLITFFYSWT